MRRRLILMLAVPALLGAAGCGDEDEPATTTTAAAPTSDQQAAIRETIYTWILEGPCDLATEEFLLTLAPVEDPAKACASFRRSFTVPSYRRKDLVISDIAVDGETATATVGEPGSEVTAAYALVDEDGRWKVDSVTLENLAGANG